MCAVLCLSSEIASLYMGFPIQTFAESALFFDPSFPPMCKVFLYKGSFILFTIPVSPVLGIDGES